MTKFLHRILFGYPIGVVPVVMGAVLGGCTAAMMKEPFAQAHPVISTILYVVATLLGCFAIALWFAEFVRAHTAKAIANAISVNWKNKAAAKIDVAESNRRSVTKKTEPEPEEWRDGRNPDWWRAQ